MTQSDPLWIGIAAIAAFGAVAFVLAAVIFLVNQLRKRGRGKVESTLVERCSSFSDELARFVADRRQNSPLWTSHGFGQKAMHKSHEESARYSAETMAKYMERFSGEALYVADKAIEFGIMKATERPRFQFPTNPLGVEHVSQEISVICLKLNEKLR